MVKINRLRDLFLRRRYDLSAVQALNDVVYEHGVASQAILYGALYAPELSEVCNSILLTWNVPDQEARDRFLDELKADKFSREELEASFNLVEVGYLFAPRGRDTSDEEDELLAEQLRASWAGYLKHQYPGREFVIEVLSPQDTGSTVGVCFYEKRHAHENPRSRVLHRA